jgi:SAM-dependent methyltransferase
VTSVGNHPAGDTDAARSARGRRGSLDLGRVAVAARVVDHVLGGWHTFPLDRRFVDEAEGACPGFISDIRANRDFGQRAVRWLAAQGIGQFLDIGCGLPINGATHETLARLGAPGRVVYVDQDPVAVAFAQNLQPTPLNVTALRGDLRDPASVLNHPDLLRRLDLRAPIAVLLLGVLGHLADTDRPARVLAQLIAHLAPGSYVVVSHPVHHRTMWREQRHLRGLYAATATPLHHRDVADVRGLLGEWELIAPGLVPVDQWPAAPPQASRSPALSMVGAVAAITPIGIATPAPPVAARSCRHDRCTVPASVAGQAAAFPLNRIREAAARRRGPAQTRPRPEALTAYDKGVAAGSFVHSGGTGDPTTDV